MGQSPPKGLKLPLKPIAPLPGTYGTNTRKKNHVTVYSPQLNLFCHIPLAPDWTMQDLKHQLRLKFTHHQSLSVYLNDCLIGDDTVLAALEVTERSLLRVEFSEDSVILEESSKDGSLGVCSAPCSLKDSAGMGSTTPDSTHSMTWKQPWEIDFSVYALPDNGVLTVPRKTRSKH